jgi:hypothetical protein
MWEDPTEDIRDIDTGKAKNMLSHHQICRNYFNIKVSDRSFEAMGWTFGVRFPAGARFFSSPLHAYQPILLSSWY